MGKSTCPLTRLIKGVKEAVPHFLKSPAEIGRGKPPLCVSLSRRAGPFLDNYCLAAAAFVVIGL